MTDHRHHLFVLGEEAPVAVAVREEARARGHVLVGRMEDADAVVDGTPPWPTRRGQRAPSALADLLPTLERLGILRLVVVGGAGALVPDSSAAQGFPRDFPTAIAAEVRALEDLRRGRDGLVWSRVDAPAVLQDGERRGVYRTGTDRALRDFRSHSSVSFADFAMAVVDELETGRFAGNPVSVAYGRVP